LSIFLLVSSSKPLGFCILSFVKCGHTILLSYLWIYLQLNCLSCLIYYSFLPISIPSVLLKNLTSACDNHHGPCLRFSLCSLILSCNSVQGCTGESAVKEKPSYHLL
jgi:hypothetical protein